MKDCIEKLYIEPTSACNLNCSMCFRHGWINEKIASMDDTTADAVMLLPQLIPSIKDVMFSGMGEPLFHKRITQMVRSFTSAGIHTQLLTNGTLLIPKMSSALINAGLSMLWVSVDGFDRNSYEQVHIGSRFDLITENLTAFNAVRGDCKLGITFVIMKDNASELSKINAFADRYKVDEINLSYAIPGSAIKETDTCYDYPFAVGKQRRVTRQASVSPKRDHCPFVEENACFIKCNGDVVPCMQLLHSSQTYLYEEERKVFCKSFGNITTQSLQSIWDAEPYSDFRQRVRDFSFSDCTLCRGCEMRFENREDCMYNEFPTCGACLWAQGIARCP